MYYKHKIHSQLQEWKTRLFQSNYSNFSNNYNFFLNKLKENKLLKSTIDNAIEAHPITSIELEKSCEQITDGFSGFSFENEQHAAAALYQILDYFKTNEWEPIGLVQNIGRGKDFYGQLNYFLENFINPIFHYLQDSIEETSFILYLLEKYKFRIEWFKKEYLVSKYSNVSSSYEQIFEDDLRLFLFDQGIDYPFSTPKSASGRSDIISQIESNDPLVLEIKIYDSKKSYKKNRIIEGFAQVVKYSNDYQKNIGYLVVFNVDNIEITINTGSDTDFPKKVIFNNKIYYIIIVNLNSDVSASKQGRLKVEVIDEKELYSNLD